jgi:hypothetical protein
MAVHAKPVRFISDVLTKKQILKTDSEDRVLFKVSSSNGHGYGCVSSSLPVTSSGLFIDGDALIAGTLTAKRMHVTEITTSVYYEDALSASINALQDVSASNANVGDMLKWDGINWIPTNNISGNFSGVLNGNLIGTASYAYTASVALSANNALNANTASYALNAATAVTALYAVNAGNLIGSGTTNTIPVFTNDTSVGNSNLSLSGSTLIAGDDFVISGGLYFSNPSIMSSISPALSSATGFYGVNDTFNAINDKFALLINNYAKLSETIVGNFNIDGTKDIQLTNFLVSDIEYLSVDVMVKYSGSSQYINDLISVALSGNIATNKVHVLLNAASLAQLDTYKVIVTKQTGSLF